MHRITAVKTLGALALFIMPSIAQAQYFGRQKVQYENFDWRVLETPHFDVHYYPEEEQATQDAARMAERWYARLSKAFQHEFKKKPLILYADHADFQQTNVISGMLNEGTGGVTEGLRSRVIMPYTGVYADNQHVLGHELVHVFQYDLASSPGGGGLAGMSRLPLWLVEGMAEYMSLGRNDPHTAMWLRDSALRGELPTIDQLTRDPRFFPYRYGQALWAYIGGKWGDRAVTELYRYATRAGWDPALQRVLGLSSNALSQQWIQSIRATYLPLIQGRQRPADAGTPVLYDDEIGAMHLAPSVSPDGRYVAYFGRRELFTIDLYVADARTGKVVKKLTSPNRDAHFDALSFIQSAGTWSPDGTKFAFPVFKSGDQQLAILDVASANVDREIGMPGIGSIQNPSWSPDGQRIAFSGMKGGISDLYVFDLGSNALQQITNDRYADLQPTWSPDGRTIAIVTDRGPSTDFNRLVYGDMEIALVDVASHQLKLVDLFPDAKNINPQFSPDGKELFFISDREGFSDIYRIVLDSNELFQVTRVATGVSGITALAPAMSVAQRSGRIMFSVFSNSGHNIYGIELADARGTPVQRAAVSAVAGLLPPVEAAGTGLIAEYLADPATGLPTQMEFATKPYKPKLGLEYIGQPSFGVGVGGYTGGAQLAGGVSAYFGDMLGNRSLGVAVQAQGTLKDVGGQAIYQNSGHRINWAGVAGHIPYLTGQTLVGPVTTQSGELVREVQQQLDRIFVDQVKGFTFYPLSTTRRFELNGGLTRYSFDREVRTFLIQAQTNRILDERTTQNDAPSALNMFEGAVAYVGDNSYFGFTSPIAGQRFRFEASPTFGTLQYQSLLADYRRYIMVRPVSFAFRALHYGRYGRDASDVRLSPLFLGYETLVRGYSIESFNASECSAGAGDQGTDCPEFSRLIGTRIGVASAELRIPLIGTEALGLIHFPFLPTELAPFVDAGVAWDSDRSPDFTFQRNSSATNIPVVSAGISTRFNILGYLVLEMYYAYPFQRPNKGWHLGFNLSPGW